MSNTKTQFIIAMTVSEDGEILDTMVLPKPWVGKIEIL